MSISIYFMMIYTFIIYIFNFSFKHLPNAIYMYIYVCIYICVCVCVCVCMYIYIYIYIYTHIYIILYFIIYKMYYFIIYSIFIYNYYFFNKFVTYLQNVCFFMHLPNAWIVCHSFHPKQVSVYVNYMYYRLCHVQMRFFLISQLFLVQELSGVQMEIYAKVSCFSDVSLEKKTTYG